MNKKILWIIPILIIGFALGVLIRGLTCKGGTICYTGIYGMGLAVLIGIIFILFFIKKK